MAEFRARIGRVRLKGGAEVTILEGGRARGLGFGETAVRHAHKMASYDEPDDPLVASLVIGLYERGTASVGWVCEKGRMPVPISLLPAWLAEIVRRDIIIDGEAREVFDAMFEWRG